MINDLIFKNYQIYQKMYIIFMILKKNIKIVEKKKIKTTRIERAIKFHEKMNQNQGN